MSQLQNLRPKCKKWINSCFKETLTGMLFEKLAIFEVWISLSFIFMEILSSWEAILVIPDQDVGMLAV